MKQVIKKEKIKDFYKQADKLWSELVKLLAWNKCEHCWKTEHLNSHHLWGRKNINLRWDTYNGMCLCPSCHKFSNVFSAHETPVSFSMWLYNLKWNAYISKMIELSEDKDNKNSVEKMKETISYLKETLKDLKYLINNK